MFQIGKAPSKEEAIQLHLYYDGMNRVEPTEDDEDGIPKRADGTPYEHMTFYLVPLTGRIARRIADNMVELDQKRNKAVMKTGAATMERITNSVIFIEGLEDERGREVKRLDTKLYDKLPAWIINALSEKLAEINGDNDDMEEEDDDSPQG